MKGILLSLLAASSLTSLPPPALADGVYIKAGPVGLSIQSSNDRYQINSRPRPYIRREEYVERREVGRYPYVERREFQRSRPYIRREEYVERRRVGRYPYVERREFLRVNDYNRDGYFR